MNGDSAASKLRERELFLEALEQPTLEARNRYLDQACAGQASLRVAVEALLAHHCNDSFLETPAVVPPSGVKTHSESHTTVLTSPLTEKPGDRIGRYKLLQKIGEGGAGAVFMAEQEEPIRRRVAVKVIKPGMDTKSVIARFETERQALALMDHPNIARVLDAGATDTGRPFFVMELVRGIRITDYCDQAHLPTPARLELFIKVCHAIQHAHQKGIIHRDIKPSNILVTLHDGVPVPKIIDFGIAKATDQRLTDKTLFTQFQAFIGTPAYMSPEQAEMSSLDVDTRTDIYSLGVLLYEMLTGKTPFDPSELISSGLDAMRRTIREQEPMSPSTRLRTMHDAERTTTAQRQQMEPAKLATLLRGDLDWIVLKALEKDRTRRYQTASDLAMDVQRYLSQEPVVARPPSSLYRFQKFARRNRLAFATATAFAAALIIGLAFSTWQYIEKSRAYRRALSAESEQIQLREEAEKARRLAETQAMAARRKAYAADINLVQQALANNNLGRAQRLLETQHPQPGQIDLRGWEWRYLWQQCQSDALFSLVQESNEISCLTASADGKWIAVGEADGSLSVWDWRARQAAARIKAGDGRLQAVFAPGAPILAFSAVSEEPAFPGRQQRIRLWNVADRRYLADLPLSGACLGLAFSTNGTELFTVASDGKAVRWKIPEGTPIAYHTLTGLSWFGSGAEVSPDLSRVAYGLQDGRLRMIDLATDKELWTVQAAEEHVQTLAFSPDGKILASGAGFVESAIRLWDVATGSEMGRLEGHHTWVSSIVFWPDGKTLASASADQTIRLWEIGHLRSLIQRRGPPDLASAESGRPLFMRRRAPFPPSVSVRPFATLRGHKLEVWDLVLLPDRSILVSGCKDGSVYVWDTTTLKRDQSHLTLPSPVQAWRIAPDSRSIIALDAEGRVSRWQGTDFQEQQPILDAGPGVINALFSPDGQFLAAAQTNGCLRVWSLQSCQVLQEWASQQTFLLPLAFLAPSNHLVTGQFGARYLQEWDLVSGQEVLSWLSTLELGPRSALAFSPGSTNAQWAFLLDADGAGHLRNLQRNQEIVMDPGLKQIGQVAFSPDLRYFAAVSRLGTGCMWETSTAAKAATFHGFLQAMNSLAFSPDGKRLAIGGDGNEAVKLWDLDSLQELLTLDGQGSMFQTTAFSPDGTLLASSNSKGILHLWRALSIKEIDQAEKPNS